MNQCSICYNPVKISYSVIGNGYVDGKNYNVKEFYDSLEEAEDFYSLVSPVSKTIIWELRIIKRCDNCGEITGEVSKTTKPDKDKGRPTYKEKRNI